METTTEIKKGYKKTKIGWIPEEWEINKLKNVCIKIQDGTHFSPTIKEKGEFKYITSKNIRFNFFNLLNVEYISREDHENIYKRCDVKCGDILLTKDGASTGNACLNILDEEFSLLSSVAFLRCNKEIAINEYLLQQILSPRGQSTIINSMAGQAITRITLTKLRDYDFPFPPLPEQQKIAQILSTWDKAIAQNQKLIEQLKSRKKGLMQQLLTGKTRLKGFSGEWKEVKLGNIADRITQKNEELNDTVVTISAQRGFVRQEDFFKKRVASDTLSGYYLIEKGNFAYNKSYSKGYPMGAFKRLDTLDKAVVTTLYICFSIKETVNSDFMVNYFEGSLMVNNLMKIAQEGGRAHGLLNLSLGDFFGLKLLIPDFVEQQAIAKVLTTADKEIQTQENYLAQLQAQKKGLMQQLLTGQKRVTVN